MDDRIAAYNEAIADAEAAQPDYPKLEDLWGSVTKERFQDVLESRYQAAKLTDVQLQAMVDSEVTAFRASLAPEAFRAQLDDLFKSTKAAAIKQLMYERDHPDTGDQPAPEEGDEDKPAGDQILSTIGTYALAVAAWLGSNAVSNWKSAGKESGVGAQVVRGALGISVRDIKKHGVFGGKRSFFRRPFG